METPINFIILGITFIPVILILFAIFCLSYYSTKDPRLSENDKKTLNKKVKKQELVLYIFNILLSICAIYIFHNYIKLFVLLPIFIIGFSIIFRAFKKIKISNILCGIIVVPTIIITIFYNSYIIFEILGGNIINFSNSQKEMMENLNFNSKFQQYEGKNITGTNVKDLVNQVITNNSDPNYAKRQVSITGAIITGSGTSFDTSNISDNMKYQVMIVEYEEGYVKEIEVTKSNQSTLNITNNITNNVSN